MTVPQIIAIGGGGFSMEDGVAPLDRYILHAAAKPEARILFLPTASGDADSYIVRFYTAFAQMPCRPSHLKFFARTPDLRQTLLSQDIIYVGGGNTKSMLAIWREWGLPALLREAWQSGVILAGLSAGAICWFEHGLTDSWGDGFRGLDCLGFLPGSCCPHYDSEPERPGVYARLVGAGAILPGYALDDLAAVHFHGTGLHRALVSSAAAAIHHVAPQDGQGLAARLPATLLT